MPTDKSSKAAKVEPEASTDVVQRPHFALKNADAVRGFLSADWIPESDSREAILGFIDQTLSAESLDELLAEDDDAESWREHLDEPVVIQGIRFLAAHDKFISDQTTIPIFAAVQVTDANGELHIYTTGAYKVVTQLKHGHDKGWWSQNPTIKMIGKDTRQGNAAYSLVKA